MSQQVSLEEHYEDFFTTFEMKCGNCQNWKIHQILSSTSKFEMTNHASCVCDLKNFNLVCCPQGLEYLLKICPELANEIANVPEKSTLDMLLQKLHNVKNCHDENDGPNFFFLKCQQIIARALLSENKPII